MIYSGEKFVLEITGVDFKESFQNNNGKICYYTNEESKFVANKNQLSITTDVENTYFTISSLNTSALEEGYLTIIIDVNEEVFKFEDIDYVSRKSWMKYKDYKKLRNILPFIEDQNSMMWKKPNTNLFKGNTEESFNSNHPNVNYLQNSLGHYETTIYGIDRPDLLNQMYCSCDLVQYADALSSNSKYYISFQYKTNHDGASFRFSNDSSFTLLNTRGEWINASFLGTYSSSSSLLTLFNNSLRSCDYASIRMIKIEANNQSMFSNYGETTIGIAVLPLMLKSLHDLEIAIPENLIIAKGDIEIALMWNNEELDKNACYNDVRDANLVVTYNSNPQQGYKYQLRLKRFGENPVFVSVGNLV